MTTAIIDTSTANIASVRFALERLDAPYVLARDPDEARQADRLILPGVGAAGPAMARLDATGWADALRAEQRPVLGLCLGMQLLFEVSEEGAVSSPCKGEEKSGVIPLLALIPGRVERLNPGSAGPWPHMGWNALDGFAPDEPLLEGVAPGERVYFVHGYRVAPGPFTRATALYGEPVTAIARKGNVAGCQFHPERSANVGARILSNFIKASS